MPISDAPWFDGKDLDASLQRLSTLVVKLRDRSRELHLDMVFSQVRGVDAPDLDVLVTDLWHQSAHLLGATYKSAFVGLRGDFFPISHQVGAYASSLVWADILPGAAHARTWGAVKTLNRWGLQEQEQLMVLASMVVPPPAGLHPGAGGVAADTRRR